VRVVSDLLPGDFVLVRAGDIVPADGRVVEGVSCANEALLTGESKPVPKSPGESVTGGSINAESPLVVQVEQVGEGTRLSAIINLMEASRCRKAAHC
jgi:Cu2+-exporting ATPase